MALDREYRVLWRHPLAVVLDDDEHLAAKLRGDGDPRRARVERILG
jgi:hypothetical protein